MLIKVRKVSSKCNLKISVQVFCSKVTYIIIHYSFHCFYNKCYFIGNAITIIIIINTSSRSIVIIKTSSSPSSSLLLLSFPDEVHLIPINNLILPLKNTQIRQVHSIFLSQFIRDMTDQPSGNYEVLMVSPGKSSLISNHVPRCQMGCSMFQNLSPFVDFLLCIGHIFCFILKLKWNA